MAHNVCFYFQVHQPYRLRDIRIAEIGRGIPQYFDEERNRTIFRKVAEKCYLPANATLLELLHGHPQCCVAFSLSGMFLDQCEEYGKDVLESFQKLVQTGRVEILAETEAHSLAAIHSLPEFCRQVQNHTQRLHAFFGITPRIFRNTELIYNNEIAHVARLMGFQGILAEGADHILQGRSPNDLYTPPAFRLSRNQEAVIRRHRSNKQPSKKISILLKNYRLSDDVAFRFSDRTWKGWPLMANTYADWIAASPGHCVNLFMDYETFGEHQWADTGIFDFLRALPGEFHKRQIRMCCPSDVIDLWDTKKPKGTFDAHACISWADLERDLSAWLGNNIQHAAMESIYGLETAVYASQNPQLIQLWRRLQTSDHFYYMCTKYWNDGDVHKYFSPYDSPYEAYRRYSHAICDLRNRLNT